AEIFAGEHGHLRDVPCSDIANRRPEIGDALARKPVEDPIALSARSRQARSSEQTEMVRGRRDALPDLAGDVLDGTLALRQHVADLAPPAVSQSRSHRGLRIEQGVLRCPSAHKFKLTFE